MTRARLVDYSGRQLGDFLLQRAALPAALAAMLSGIAVYVTIRSNGAGYYRTPPGQDEAAALMVSMLSLFLPLGAFLGINGLISTDRRQGWFRMLFSKPVAVPAYYAQAFAVHGAAYVAVAALLVTALGAVTTRLPVLAAVEAAALTFVLMGGLGFLLSAATRLDGWLLAAVWLASSVVRPLAAPVPSPLPRWLSALAVAMPPVEQLDSLRLHLYARQPVDATALWHVVVWGAAAFLAGVAVVRRAPLAR